jgi:hypothetical protein
MMITSKSKVIFSNSIPNQVNRNIWKFRVFKRQNFRSIRNDFSDVQSEDNDDSINTSSPQAQVVAALNTKIRPKLRVQVNFPSKAHNLSKLLLL